MKEDLDYFLRKKIVVDTQSSWIYIGTLEEVTDVSVVLSDVDVHDSKDSVTSKELYVMESKITGVKANRNLVYINRAFVVSFSPLEDVKQF